MPDLMASIPDEEEKKQPLLRWFFTTQFVMEKAPVWKARFMHKLTLCFVAMYGYQVYHKVAIDEHFTLLIGMILGYYFQTGHKGTSGE